MLMASSAWAEWSLTASAPDDGNKFYLDYNTIESDGNFVYAWTLIELAEQSSNGDLSQSGLYKVDCNIPKKYKYISFITYKGSMGTGGVNTSLEPENEPWSYPPPGSVSEIMLSRICSYYDYKDGLGIK